MKINHACGLVCIAIFFAASAELLAAETTGDIFTKAGWKPLTDSLEFPAEIRPESGSPNAIPLIELESPGIDCANHLVAGEIRYEGVAGTAYLEMWTVYENGERYFSRTLGEVGPSAKLSGDSDWRLVSLPFLGSADRKPARLEINVVLPGGGTVEFRHFKLYQSDEVLDAGMAHLARQGARRAALAIGVVVALVLSAMLMTSGGRARRLVLAIMAALIAVGITGIIGGTAMSSGRTPDLWLPLLVGGSVALLAGAIGFPFFRQAYLKRELRQISAADRIS